MRTPIYIAVYISHIYILYIGISVCLSVCWGFGQLNSCLCCCSAKLAKLNLLLPAAGHWGNLPTQAAQCQPSARPPLPLPPPACSCLLLQLSIAFGFAFRLVVVCFWSDFAVCLACPFLSFLLPSLPLSALKIENHNRINFGSSQKFVLPRPPYPKVGNEMRRGSRASFGSLD